MQQESGLFEIRLNDQGKKFIQKFVGISYTILVLVIFGSATSIYWNIRMLVIRRSGSTASEIPITTYETIIPYCSIFFSIIAVFSNFYYVRFPRVLLRKIELNDEVGVNQAFGLLFKGALIFLFWLIFSTVTTIWSLLIY
jgi:hypothetical protein